MGSDRGEVDKIARKHNEHLMLIRVGIRNAALNPTGDHLDKAKQTMDNTIEGAKFSQNKLSPVPAVVPEVPHFEETTIEPETIEPTETDSSYQDVATITELHPANTDSTVLIQPEEISGTIYDVSQEARVDRIRGLVGDIHNEIDSLKKAS